MGSSSPDIDRIQIIKSNKNFIGRKQSYEKKKNVFQEE
jgi:hypothetical protein